MLLTRCPDCDTTFRVTDETLKKANGQVRCGRCASVFNAYAELQDSDAKSYDAPPPTSVLTTPRRAEASARADPVAPTTATAQTGPSETAADSIATHSIADVVAETAIAEAQEGEASAESTAEAEDFEGISAHEVDEVLASTATAAPAEGPPSWPGFDAQGVRQPVSRWWTAAVALALVALGAQAVHYFRADVANHPTFGPLIQSAYALLGTEIEPRWDVRQYAILDWVATAEPNERGLGSLKITARIQNRGPLRQPYPAVQLRLKDRWDKAVSSRVFTPTEYLLRESSSEQLMAPGETTRAEMEVVDPGPDAYGFELDVCIEVEASLVTCGTDEVFL
jgi:predicted Zn finger-like uncharacterized protein